MKHAFTRHAFFDGTGQDAVRDMGVKMGAQRTAERGFGLIELMISLTIGLVLVLGVTVMASNMQLTYSLQSQFAGINDKERFAAALLGNATQTAGYFSPSLPTPPALITSIPTITGMLVAEPGAGAAATYVAGQAVAGSTGASSTVPDTLNVRFQIAAGDINNTNNNIVNCQGGSVAATAIVESVFSIDTIKGNLVCQVGLNGATPGTAMVLIDGVSNMKILYGVDVNGSGSATEYFPASSMTSALWSSVHSVNVTLTFAPTKQMNSPQTYSQTFLVMYAQPS